MKITKFSFVVACFLIAMNSYSVEYNGSGFNSLIQNPSGRNEIGLNGQWNYIIDQYETGYYNHRYEVSRMAGLRTGKW